MENESMKTTRREFIKTSSKLGLGISLAALPISAGFTKNKKKVRLAVLGTGGRGRYLMNHLFAQRKTLDYEIVALCDIYKPSLDEALRLCKVNGITLPKTFSDHRTMIKNCEIDGVINATPLFVHAHTSIDCMNAGIHVLCEKAMARTLDDVKAMYDTHKATGSILLIGHQRLFDAKYLHAMKSIHNADIGQIGQIKAYWHRNNDWRRPLPEGKPELEKQLNWRLYKEYSAGLLTELMSHQLQVANWAMQKAPVSVMGTGSINYYHDGREVPDNIVAIFSYDDGTQFIYDSITMNKLEGLEEKIFGNLGTMLLETNKYISEKEPDIPPAPGIVQLVNDIQKGLFNDVPIGGSSWDLETAVKRNGEPIFEGQVGDGTKEELISFVKFVQQGSSPEWMLKEAYNSSIWTLLSEQAIDKGIRITCPEKYVL